MSQEIAKREGGLPVVLSRAAARKLSQIQGDAIMERAQIEAEEQNAAFKADRRMENGYLLASHLVSNAGVLSHEVTSVTKDNPGLEMILRGVEEDVAVSSRAIIHSYMARRI
jgi:hypothetical protein